MKAMLGCTAAIAIAFAAMPVAAQDYPWCAQYNCQGGGQNCGFSTLQQCEAAISGNGGFCARNLLYTTPAVASRTRRSKPQG
jgi:hypothetical protein